MTKRAPGSALLLLGVLASRTALAQESPAAPPAPAGEAEAATSAPRSPPHETPPAERAPAPYVPPARTTPEPTSGLAANLGVGFALLPTPPDMSLTTPDGGAMSQFGGAPVRHVGTTSMVDFSISVLYRTASILTLPLLGVEVGVPVSTGYPASIPLASKGASLTWERGGPTYTDGLDILGLGVTIPAGNVRVAVDALPGFRYFYTTGTITQGLLTIDAEARQYTFSLHADASLCVGTRGVASACLFATPYVFEFARWMNGAAFGARLETN
jgi:hypothetical protein